MNVLYILAHPDDAEIWCGGTILRQKEKGYNVKILYLFSSKSRKKEALMLSRHGVEVEIIKPKEKVLRSKIKQFSPDIIVTHWFKDCHHQHKRCFDMLYGLLPELLVFDRLKFSLFVCDTYNSVGYDNSLFTPNRFQDITDLLTFKTNIINNHKSQPCDYFINMVSNQNKMWGQKNKCKYAEAFLKLPVQGVYYDNEL